MNRMSLVTAAAISGSLLFTPDTYSPPPSRREERERSVFDPPRVVSPMERQRRRAEQGRPANFASLPKKQKAKHSKKRR